MGSAMVGLLITLMLGTVLPVLMNKSTEHYFQWIKANYIRPAWFGFMWLLALSYVLANNDMKDYVTSLHQRTSPAQGFLGAALAGVVLWWVLGFVFPPKMRPELDNVNPAFKDAIAVGFIPQYAATFANKKEKIGTTLWNEKLYWLAKLSLGNKAGHDLSSVKLSIEFDSLIEDADQRKGPLCRFGMSGGTHETVAISIDPKTRKESVSPTVLDSPSNRNWSNIYFFEVNDRFSVNDRYVFLFLIPKNNPAAQFGEQSKQNPKTCRINGTYELRSGNENVQYHVDKSFGE